MQGQYWQRHPTQVAFLRAFLAGEWVTRSFGWFSMMVSRFAGPVMTIAVGYLILYAIDSHHGLSTVVSHPTVWDSIAQVASGIINVTPELVFPGTVVLSIQALLRRSWLHGALYATASLMFAVLTILLLQAYMTGGLTDSFLSDMLLWRAVSALSYTVVAEVCSHHDGVQSADAGVQSPGVQAQLTDLVNQVNQLQSELNRVQQVQRTVQSGVHLQGVQSSQEAQPKSEPAPTEPEQQGVNQESQERLNPLPEQQAEHTYRAPGAVNHTVNGSLHQQERLNPPTSEPLPLVSSAVNQRSEPALNPESEPLHSSLVSEQRAVNHQRSEPGKGVLVQQFIREQMAQGTTPTLDEIMEACQCSRNTAIRHRRAILNETTQEERKPSHPVVVLAERRGK
jgi:hypothetical protein